MITKFIMLGRNFRVCQGHQPTDSSKNMFNLLTNNNSSYCLLISYRLNYKILYIYFIEDFKKSLKLTNE